MNQIIDLALELPPTTSQMAGRLKILLAGRMANTPTRGLTEGTNNPAAAVLEKLQTLAAESARDPGALTEAAAKMVTPLPQFIERMVEAGIEYGVIDAGTPAQTGELLKLYPVRFLGAVAVNPYHGMNGVKELEAAVAADGIKCLNVHTDRFGLGANDKKWYPFYTKAAELNIPVILRESDVLGRDTADIREPLYVDEVSSDFPELCLVAGLGNWPWPPEIIGLARRHDNLYVSLRPNASLSRLHQERLALLAEALPDRIVFASGPAARTSSLLRVVEDAVKAGLKPETKEKWLNRNAKHLFRIS